MSVFNRRNALLGYLTWVGVKVMAKQKARKALPSVDAETKRPNKSAIALAVAAGFGALMFWKSRSSEESP